MQTASWRRHVCTGDWHLGGSACLSEDKVLALDLQSVLQKRASPYRQHAPDDTHCGLPGLGRDVIGPEMACSFWG